MNLNPAKSIQVKIMLWTGLCLFLVATILVGYAATSLYNTASSATEKRARTEAELYTAYIKAQMDVALDTVHSLVQEITLLEQDAATARLVANTKMKNVLLENSQIVGVYTVWEFSEGMDSEIDRYDEAGRFAPYWTWDEAGAFVPDVLSDHEVEGVGDYYQLIRGTLEEEIIGPHIRSTGSGERSVISLIVPIIQDGRFYGIVGVDLGLDFLQDWVDQVDLYGRQAELALISSNGTLAVVTRRPSLVGKPIDAYHKDVGHFMADVREGKSAAGDAGDWLVAFVPVQFGSQAALWVVNLNIPLKVIAAEANRLTLQMVVIGGILTTFALILLGIAAGRIAQPIRRVTDMARLVAEGNLEVSVDVRSLDEVGMLASTFNDMTARLREMLRQEEERTVELQREVAERERLQQEVIDAQRRAIQELSAPVIPVMDRIIVMPLIGSIDSMRARDITRALLVGIREQRAKVVILDITGVPLVDSGVASHLNKTIQAARLKGAHTIVTGISDAVAETIVDLGIDWKGIDTVGDLQTGLRTALAQMGQYIVG
jgi:anti-anti-sigma regulatory factor/HAMP domain-containing protein